MALLAATPFPGAFLGFPLGGLLGLFGGFLVGAMAVGVSAHGRIRALAKQIEALEELIWRSHALINERCETALIEEATKLLQDYSEAMQ